MAEVKLVRVCTWLQADFESDVWETLCGNLFLVNDGRPKENGFNFCCYCGHPLIEGTPESKDEYN